MFSPLPHALDLTISDAGSARNLESFTIYTHDGSSVVRSSVDSHQGLITLTRPYVLKSGVGYAIRYHNGETQLWEVKQFGPDVVAFIREARTNEERLDR